MSERILLTDDNKVQKYLDEYDHSTIRKESDNGYPTIDHKERYYNDKINNIAEFDGRNEWADFITPVLHVNQSSWNTATIRALSIRFTILSVGQVMPRINYSQMMYCPIKEITLQDEKIDKFRRSVYYALNYLYIYGASHVGCFNYKAAIEKGYAKFEDFSSVDDMIDRYDSCKIILGKDYSQCLDNTDARYFRSIFNANIANNKESIKWDIIKFGPVVSTMDIYDDFKNYNGMTLYRGPNQSNKLIGARSVTILGWGVENGEEYWIVDPNLGLAWGNEGYFKMKMDIEKCKLESSVVSIYPDLEKFSEYILDLYKDYKIDEKLKEMRKNIKVDLNSFLLEGRSRFVKKNYPNIKINFINRNILPDYNTFYAKDVDYFIFRIRKDKGIGYKWFFSISIIIVIIGLLLIFIKKNK